MHLLLLFGRGVQPPPAWIFDVPAIAVVDERPHFVKIGVPRYSASVQELALKGVVTSADLSPKGSSKVTGVVFTQIGVGNPVGRSSDAPHPGVVVTEVPGYHGKVH